MARRLQSIDESPVRIDGEGRQKDYFDMAIKERQGGTTPTATPTSEYDIRRGQSARDLLDLNVQTFIADEVARKNSRAKLEGMGLANSGFGGTASALQGNALREQLMKNQRTYSDAIAGINAEELASDQQALASEADLLTQNLSQLNGQAIVDYMDNHGFKQKNGVWYDPTGRYSETMMKQINDTIWLRNYAEEATRQTELAQTYGVTDATPRLDSVQKAVDTITLADGSKGSKIEYELYELFTDYADRPDGFVARLVNGSNANQYATLMKIDGQWVQVNDDVYDMTPANSKTQLKNSAKPPENKSHYGAEAPAEMYGELNSFNKLGQVVRNGKTWIYNPDTKKWYEYVK